MNAWWKGSVLSTAGWNDWLDILLMSWMIYRGMLLVRGTRAQQSLIGLALVGGIYLMSERLGLSTLNWVLDHVFVYVVLALLILFQDDIRKALAQAGGTLFHTGPPAGGVAVLQQIIEAAFALAQRKIGAIIVVERLASLDPFLDGAHLLDARVSAELMQAIFHPSSPIHDGAVVVRGERLVAAGVFLPLSTAKDLSRAYGTRHRAAIGLAEALDALCIVISEERGTISLIEGGVVTPVADANDLRDRLSEGLERMTSQSASLSVPVTAPDPTKGEL